MAWSDIITAPPPEAPGPKPTPEQLANLPSAVGYASPQLPPAQTWNPAPILKQVLETPTGLPPVWQSLTPPRPGEFSPMSHLLNSPSLGAGRLEAQMERLRQAPSQVPEKSPAAEEIKIPGATAVKPATVGAGSTEEIKIPGATAVKPAATDTTGAAEEIKIPGATAVKPAEQVPAKPQPQPETPSQPPVTYPTIAEDQPDTQEQVKALVQQGHSPGAAQAIAAGQEPKTVTGETPPPKPEPTPKTEQQAPKPIDTLTADARNRVDPVSLYSYLLGKFANSGLVGYVPPDGARWGIKTGSAAEWAAFGLAVAKQESDLNTRSYNAADPGGSAGLFQFGQGQKPYVQGDQFNPQQSADAFVRAVEHYLANKGRVADMGEIFGSIKRPNEAGQYIAGAQKVAAGGTGKDLVSSGGGDGGGSPPPGGQPPPGGPPPPGGQPAGQPMVSIPSAGGHPQLSGQGPSGGGWSGDSGYGGGRETTPRTADTSFINLSPLLEAGLSGIAAGSLFRGGGAGRPQAAQPSEEKGPSPSDVVAKVLAAGGAPPAPGAAPVDLSTMKQANVLSAKPVGAPQLGLPAPPAAPSTAPAAPDPIVIKGLMKLGFTREQALAFAAKASVSKPGAALTGGASFRKPLQLPAPPPAPSRQPPAAAKPQPVPPQPQAPQRPVPSPQAGIAPRGSTVGVPNPPGGPSPDDPRVKKQKDNLTKGEHFVAGDDFHDQLLAGLPGGHGGQQRQLLGQAEEAIAEKRPIHISYISAPKEAAKFPTRESRTIQYEAHSPEARLMGTTEGQLVGHSLIPVAVGVSPSRKAGEPHQSYIQGISTNVIANNFAHLNTKLAAMGLKTPYAQFGPKFANDLEGYLHNLNAGHTGTGRGYALGTAEYPNEPDTSHVPYKLNRHEADFLGAVINNTAAFAKHEDAKALRELARVNGTLITPEGETNRLRHQIEQHEPGWRQRVLEPSIRSFKTGLVHEIHPTEEHMPATIRPGQDYRSVTEAMQRTSERGRPDVPVAVSLHHTFADNKAINQIERDFSEERISEAEARQRLHALGEDPDQYQFVGGSGGLITPYEENPEAITPEEHAQLKDNLRKQWIGGKMPIEDYRRKTAEVPLPEIPSRQKETPSDKGQVAATPHPVGDPDHAMALKLWNEHGTEGLKKLLQTSMTVGELKDKYGLELSGEKMHRVLSGAAAFPKIAAFYSNLNQTPGGVLKMQGGGMVPDPAPRAQPVDPGTQVLRAQPVDQPPPASNWDQILQNAAPKYTGQPGGKTTVFATPKDLRDWEVHHSYKTGDNGVGSPALGSVDTANSHGVAVPEKVMTKLYGGKASDPSTTANWRTARAQVTVNGKTYVVPISDVGPSDDQVEKGYITDLTSDLAKGIPGWMSDDSDGPVKIKLLPPGSGPDYLTDRKGWQAEQQKIGKQLTPTPLGSSDIVNPLQYQNPPASGQTPD